MMAKLLTMVNANVAEINRNDPKGEMASEKLALPGISRAEFMKAMSDFGKKKPAKQAVPGQPGMSPIGPTPQGGALATTDVALTLKSIESILQNIQQILLSLITTQQK